MSKIKRTALKLEEKKYVQIVTSCAVKFEQEES